MDQEKLNELFPRVNPRALEAALSEVVGDEDMQQVLRLYRVIDAAELRAAKFTAGLLAEKEWTEAEAARQTSYDAGYEEGVVDGIALARLNPREADAVIIENLSGEFPGSVRGVDEDIRAQTQAEQRYYEGDSGDEDNRRVR